MATELRVMGRIEMAKFLEVDTRTPHAWASRNLLPPPDYPAVNGGPAWDRSTIIAWAQRTGRLPERLAYEGSMYGEAPSKRGGRKAKRTLGHDASTDDAASEMI